ncbi:MAG: thiopurine S-methyltransferase [Hyphomicrobiales bacterium]|nr:thiopurine S-methyltransferase [Hyphomicrobiales bacterium]
MDPAFWQQGWKENQIAFHEEEVNPLLSKNIHRLALNRGDRIFVPLCGKTSDLAWLSAQGFRVVGIELNQSAVEEVFVNMGTDPDVSDLGDYVHYRSETVEILVGDFFDLSAEILGPIEATYDRAALVALPAPMRGSYAAHLMALTGTAPQLLIALDYDQSQMDGPPFSVSGGEISRLYSDRYSQELVSSAAISGRLAKRCTGTENAWLL